MANAISERDGETTRLGSYEIIRRLARGGMAEIFLARTTEPDGSPKLVVLKKILPKYVGKPWFVQLFLDEAKLAAGLDHPHIARVFDIGITDGSYFFVMEYLHGQDVRSILHRTWRTGERFPLEHAVQIARHVASALHFAHEQQGPDGVALGIVHRDVSPSNVIVTYDGETKLLDFGVAKTTARSVKTRTGALKGKISYMSPEQARGAPIDRRSDIFSLGIVLWEMVTTQRLYRGGNDLATLQLIITQPPRPPSSVRPDMPPELERIVLRALAQNPDDRYATAEQLVNDLDELARAQDLEQSASALSATVSELFGTELGAWREARAAGVPLAVHLHDAGDITTAVSESDFIELDGEDDDDDELDELVEDDPSDDRSVDTPLPDTVLARPGRPPTQGAPRPPTQGAPRASTQGAPRASTQGAPRAPSQGIPREASQGIVREPSQGISAPSSGAVRAPSSAVTRTPSAGVARTPSPHVVRARSPGVGSALATNGAAVGAPRVVHPPSIHDEPTRAVDQPNIHEAPTRAVDQPAFVDDDPHADDDEELTLHAVTVIEGVEPHGDDPVETDPLIPTDPTTAVLAQPEPATSLSGEYTAQVARFSPDVPVPSAPFAAPPWHSGAAGPTATVQVSTVSDRIRRSWAIIDLPAFDPETFERHRRIVLRVTGGVIGFILLLAIIAGRC